MSLSPVRFFSVRKEYQNDRSYRPNILIPVLVRRISEPPAGPLKKYFIADIKLILYHIELLKHKKPGFVCGLAGANPALIRIESIDTLC
jgi:hypothetical protein